jgi:hypothetical protein
MRPLINNLLRVESSLRFSVGRDARLYGRQDACRYGKVTPQTSTETKKQPATNGWLF